MTVTLGGIKLAGRLLFVPQNADVEQAIELGEVEIPLDLAIQQFRPSSSTLIPRSDQGPDGRLFREAPAVVTENHARVPLDATRPVPRYEVQSRHRDLGGTKGWGVLDSATGQFAPTITKHRAHDLMAQLLNGTGEPRSTEEWEPLSRWPEVNQEPSTDTGPLARHG